MPLTFHVLPIVVFIFCAADGPGFHGLPHAAVDSRPALAHARHRPAESLARMATIALPHGIFLVSKRGLGSWSDPSLQAGPA